MKGGKATPGGVKGKTLSTCRFFERFGPDPLIIAHRGFRACYPENTRCAFDQSLGRSRMIELDVRLCRDGVAVVFHDADLSRTTNAALVAERIGCAGLALHDWQLSQLRLLDLGSWFLDADPFGMLECGAVDRASLAVHMPQRILTLEEVLIWATAHSMPLNIEIKDEGGTRGDDLIVPEVIRTIRKAGVVDAIVLSSFNHQYLRCCRQIAPEIALAALQRGIHPPDLIAYLRSLEVCAYHPENALADEDLIADLRAAGIAVNVFTVNTPSRQQQLFRWGVTGIFTDFLHPFSRY